jgi:hypothetical protein
VPPDQEGVVARHQRDHAEQGQYPGFFIHAGGWADACRVKGCVSIRRSEP